MARTCRNLLQVRDRFASLSHREAMAVLPVIMAKRSTDIEKLQQSGQLWESLTPLERTTAITTHLSRTSPAERKQIINSSTQVHDERP